MIRVFYLTYNDRLVHNILVDHIKFKNDDNFFHYDKISFGYMKNDFGRELFKVTIKILYTIDKYNKITEKNNSMYQKIIFHGRKLLEYSIIKKEIPLRKKHQRKTNINNNIRRYCNKSYYRRSQVIFRKF